jgi:hypothetical protein
VSGKKQAVSRAHQITLILLVYALAAQVTAYIMNFCDALVKQKK